MRRQMACVAFLASGALAGLTTLALDQAALGLLLGYTVPVYRLEIMVYLAAGVTCGLVATLVRKLSEGDRCSRNWWEVSPVAVWAGAMGTMAIAIVAGRVHHQLHDRLPVAADWVVASLVALTLCFGCRWILRRAMSQSRVSDGAAEAWSGFLVAAAVGMSVAVNHHVFDSLNTARTLAADLLILSSVYLTACLVGRFGSGVVAAALALILATIVSATRVSSITSDATTTGPHVVLIIVDTLRQDVFRSVLDETPIGRRFQRELGHAAYFDQAIAASPWTVPSVASIMTGLYPQEHGHGRFDEKRRLFFGLSASAKTLAEVFQAAGYRTEALVTNPWLHGESGIERGFERFEELGGTEAMLPTLRLARQLRWIPFRWYQPAEAVRQRFARRLAVADDRPLFAWLHLMDPHVPYRRHPDLEEDPVGAELSPDDRLYRDEVRHALREITRIFELLRQRNMWNETAVLLTSDHGEILTGDDRGQGSGHRQVSTGHGHALFEELVRIPLVVRPAGGLQKPVRIATLVGQVHLAGMIEKLAGFVPAEASGNGSDALGLLEIDKSPSPAAVLSSIDTDVRQQALRTHRWKLIRFPDGQFPDEVYDLLNDPGERDDLGRTNPELAAALRLDLAEALAQLSIAEDAALLRLSAEERAKLRALGYLE